MAFGKCKKKIVVGSLTQLAIGMATKQVNSVKIAVVRGLNSIITTIITIITIMITITIIVAIITMTIIITIIIVLIKIIISINFITIIILAFAIIRGELHLFDKDYSIGISLFLIQQFREIKLFLD